VFGQSDFLGREDSEGIFTNKVTIEKNFNSKVEPKETMVKTRQEIIYKCDGNNREKKRIIPSRLVPQSELKNNEMTVEQVTIAGSSANHSATSTANVMLPPKSKVPTIRLPPMKQ
jgi:hypothetical protein